MTRRFFDDEFTNAVNTDSRRRILTREGAEAATRTAIGLTPEEPDEADALDQIEQRELRQAPFDFEPMHILGADQPGILSARLGAPSTEQYPGLKSCSFFDNYLKK